MEAISLGARASKAWISYVRSLVKTFWFSDLVVFYPRPPSWPAAWVAGSGLLLLSVSVLAIGSLRRWPYLAVGWLWYFATLLPVIGLIQVGRQAMADRYTYLPTIGLTMALVWGIWSLLQGWRARVVVATSLGLVCVLCLSYATARQVGTWRDSVTLFTRAVERTGANAEAQFDLGLALVGAGQSERAIEHYREALRIRPREARTHHNLGNAYQRVGRLDDAIGEYRATLELEPNHPRAYPNLALALLRRGRAHEAIQAYERADLRERLDLDSRFNLGVAYQQTREMARAEHEFRLALETRPGWAEAHNALGVALAEQERLDEAIGHFTEAIRLKPDFPEARAHLALARSKQAGP